MAIGIIKKKIAAGEYSISKHAAERMAQRGISTTDIEACAKSGTFSVDLGRGPNRYTIDGKDVHGDAMTVAVVWVDPNIVIVTVI